MQIQQTPPPPPPFPQGVLLCHGDKYQAQTNSTPVWWTTGIICSLKLSTKIRVMKMSSSCLCERLFQTFIMNWNLWGNNEINFINKCTFQTSTVKSLTEWWNPFHWQVNCSAKTAARLQVKWPVLPCSLTVWECFFLTSSDCLSASLCSRSGRCYFVQRIDNAAHPPPPLPTSSAHCSSAMSSSWHMHQHRISVPVMNVASRSTRVCSHPVQLSMMGQSATRPVFAAWRRGHLWKIRGHLWRRKGHLWRSRGHLWRRRGHLWRRGHL